MKKFKNLVLSTVCAISLSACTFVKKDIISLPESLQREMGSTDVYIEECEKKMKADVEDSNLTAYDSGLLFVLIDCAIVAHRDGAATDAMVEIQKEMEAFNFQEKFRSRLTHSLQNTNWLHVKRVNYITGINDEAHEEIFKKATTDCVLTSKFLYKLNPDMNVMTGTLYVTVYPTSVKMKQMVKAENPLDTPIFKFHVTATEALPNGGKDMEGNAKSWAQNNGLYLKRALENIINHVFIKLDKVLKEPNHLPED